ncbi:protein FAR1-RELATED SEQUENCE 5-like [Juglans regia]|uniref:Protein FAR1-RELATED SEQUENCE n=1 Tax=Juglans regia TaxID=51240 RepID=A0A6P9EUF3_JUGRE|nr:protein FAR1-RELATED SEQUENCE 5-like [Juglans regia]
MDGPLSSTGEDMGSFENPASNVETETDDIIQQNSDNDRVGEEPKPGMKFATEHELMAYYMRYVKQQGFGVITQRTKREANGRVKYLTIGCARGGKYHPSHSNISRPCPTIKTDCKARINAHLVEGSWVVTIVEIGHNHSTVSPQKSRFFRSHKCLDEYSQRMLDLNDRVGIRMNKNFGALVVDAGGFENLQFQEKDYRNFIDKARQLRLGKGGGEALTEYFKRMRLQNDGFVYVIDVDEELRLRNVFWADARSRAAYKYFGDVITFDTTYLTNRYGMPFAPFVRVNHHGQSILLGAGLISSENTSTFVWLFWAWLECMDARAPKAIITDQDRAMKSAIAVVFPHTRHRYCLWHIMRKLSEKLGSHAAFNAGLKTAIQNALYDSQTCGEFEEKWGQFIKKYGLCENAWLQGLYNERSFWVPVYLKGVFWAGMSTTQRSESMNAFFDGFVHFGTTLKEFVDQFDNALRKKVELETTANFNSSNQTIPCSSAFRIEKQFQSVYTNAKFKEVQREVWGMILCNCILISKECCISTYDVLDEITTDDDHVKSIKYTVYFNNEEVDVKCTCALFEMSGIVCRHALNIQGGMSLW